MKHTACAMQLAQIIPQFQSESRQAAYNTSNVSQRLSCYLKSTTSKPVTAKTPYKMHSSTALNRAERQ